MSLRRRETLAEQQSSERGRRRVYEWVTKLLAEDVQRRARETITAPI